MYYVLKSNHLLVSKDDVIGVDQENKSELLIIEVEPIGLLNKQPFIEFEISNGEKYSSEELTFNDNKLYYLLPNVVLKSGTLKIQVIFRGDEDYVWKSFETNTLVRNSINASDYIEASYPDFVGFSTKMLNKIYNCVSNGGGGGSTATLPTLFPPVISIDNNIVTWTNNVSNGGFQVDLQASIDGNEVQQPLQITNELNGKTIIVRATSNNFESSVTQQILEKSEEPVVEQTYNVSLKKYSSQPYDWIDSYLNDFSYSVDGGNTWNQFTKDEPLIRDAKQVTFRVEHNGAFDGAILTSQSLGLNIYVDMNNQLIDTSSDYTLTEDITDLEILVDNTTSPTAPPVSD